jgi:phospholipid/cholesterol/gamma-HCH transport system ATP-binding protein
MDGDAQITVRDLTIAFGDFEVMHGLDFVVRRHDVFIIMGPSGSGKSTLLRHLVGLDEPVRGDVLYGAVSFTHADAEARARLLRRVGILYQLGALFSSMSLAENVSLPLAEYTDLPPAEIRELVSLKLALVGLRGFEDFYPAQLSGGMVKRAGLARAMALDPDILFFDEPSSGLDPVSSRLLDDLILELRDTLGATIVVVTHELASIFTIGTNSVYLDPETRTMAAVGPPAELRGSCDNPRVRRFLTRGAADANGGMARG